MTAASERTSNEAWAREVLFRRLMEERDLSDPYEYWTDDSVDHFLAAGQSVRGAQALAAWFARLFAAVPDWSLVVDNVVDDGGDQVVVQWTGTGTFTGASFLGIEPTGRRVEIRGCDVIRLDGNGKVATNTVYYDGAAFARQVGMLPAAGSRADLLITRAFNGFTRLRRRFSR